VEATQAQAHTHHPVIAFPSIRNTENLFNHRPIRDSHHGRNVIIPAAAARRGGAAASRGGHRPPDDLGVVRQDDEVHHGARAGGLPADRVHQPEGESVPREVVVHRPLRRTCRRSAGAKESRSRGLAADV